MRKEHCEASGNAVAIFIPTLNPEEPKSIRQGDMCRPPMRGQ